MDDQNTHKMSPQELQNVLEGLLGQIRSLFEVGAYKAGLPHLFAVQTGIESAISALNFDLTPQVQTCRDCGKTRPRLLRQEPEVAICPECTGKRRRADLAVDVEKYGITFEECALATRLVEKFENDSDHYYFDMDDAVEFVRDLVKSGTIWRKDD